MGKLIRVDGARNGPTGAECLRELADAIERGEYGDAPRVVMIVGAKFGDRLTAHAESAGMGAEPLIETLALIELGKAAVLKPEYD